MEEASIEDEELSPPLFAVQFGLGQAAIFLEGVSADDLVRVRVTAQQAAALLTQNLELAEDSAQRAGLHCES